MGLGAWQLRLGAALNIEEFYALVYRLQYRALHKRSNNGAFYIRVLTQPVHLWLFLYLIHVNQGLNRVQNHHGATALVKRYLHLFLRNLRCHGYQYREYTHLKNKIQIHGFLGFLSNNMWSDFIFRVAMYLKIAKTAHLWDP